MKLESCNRANSARRGKDGYENFLEGRIDGNKTFQERVKLAGEKVDLIIDAPTYRKLSDELLERIGIEEIKNMS